MRTVGIDYSLSSPCICINTGAEFNIFNCSFHYLASSKKYEGINGNLNGILHTDFTSDEQRYASITTWALKLLEEGDVICIEGYSMGSTGRVFNIAENAGLLKH